jgi:hypothetical protein
VFPRITVPEVLLGLNLPPPPASILELPPIFNPRPRRGRTWGEFQAERERESHEEYLKEKRAEEEEISIPESPRKQRAREEEEDDPHIKECKRFLFEFSSEFYIISCFII